MWEVCDVLRQIRTDTHRLESGEHEVVCCVYLSPSLSLWKFTKHFLLCFMLSISQLELYQEQEGVTDTTHTK